MEKGDKTGMNAIDKEEKDKSDFFEKIKKKINLETPGVRDDNEFLYYINPNYHYIKDGKEKKYHKNSRYIIFQNEINNFNKTYFIHDNQSLEIALEKSEIKNVILVKTKYSNANESEKNNKVLIDDQNLNVNNSNDWKSAKSSKSSKDSKNSNGSNSSSQSSKSLDLEEILNSSIDLIKEEKPIKKEKIYSLTKFNKRFIISNISDLDFNFKYYYKEKFNNNKIDILKCMSKFFDEIRKIYAKNFISKLIVLGPKGVGKTTSILIFLRAESIPSLFFPIKKMNKFGNRRWRKIAFNESLYIFKNKDEMESFKNNSNNAPNAYNLFEFIFEFIKFVFEFYEKKN